MSPAFAGRFLSTVPPGKSSLTLSINQRPIWVNKLLFSKLHYLLGKLSLIYPSVQIILNRNFAVESHMLGAVRIRRCLLIEV